MPAQDKVLKAFCAGQRQLDRSIQPRLLSCGRANMAYTSACSTTFGVLHDDDMVAHVLYDVHLVRDDNDRDAELGGDA